MADNSGVLKLAMIAGAGYLAYKQGWLASFGIGAPVAAAPATPATPAPNPAAITGANTVAGIQARVIAAAKAPAEGLGVDTWGSFLNQELAKIGKTAPDPMPLFTAASPGFDRSQLVNALQYFTVMAPALKAQTGLSGFGLYAYAGGRR